MADTPENNNSRPFDLGAVNGSVSRQQGPPNTPMPTEVQQQVQELRNDPRIQGAMQSVEAPPAMRINTTIVEGEIGNASLTIRGVGKVAGFNGNMKF